MEGWLALWYIADVSLTSPFKYFYQHKKRGRIPIRTRMEGYEREGGKGLSYEGRFVLRFLIESSLLRISSCLHNNAVES